MVEKLKVGQTRTQVRLILGTPLVVTVFRDDRWDYSYLFLRQGRVVEQRNFTVYFVDEKLARWEGDEAPASAVELNREAAARTVGEMKWGSERSLVGQHQRHVRLVTRGDANRDRRRRRPHGTGADRGGAGGP